MLKAACQCYKGFTSKLRHTYAYAAPYAEGYTNPHAEDYTHLQPLMVGCVQHPQKKLHG